MEECTGCAVQRTGAGHLRRFGFATMLVLVAVPVATLPQMAGA
jgi:hypothetical protein